MLPWGNWRNQVEHLVIFRWDHGDLTSNSGAFKQTADMMMYDVNIVGIYCVKYIALSLNGDSTSNSGMFITHDGNISWDIMGVNEAPKVSTQIAATFALR